MAKLKKLEKVLQKQKDHDNQDNKLRGTFASVMILGGFIAGCWLFVFILFMIRNGG